MTERWANPTGAELADAVEQEAHRRGESVELYAAPLSRWPYKWLTQLRAASRPKAATVERIRALLEGRAVPPPPGNNFQKNGPPRLPVHVARAGPALEQLPPRVDREPCLRCGIRADVGCRHAPAQREFAHG